MKAVKASSIDSWDRFHAWAALLPWVPWLGWQLWLADAARLGREAFTARLSLMPTGVGFALDAFVLCAVGVHVLIGVRIVLRDPAPRSAGTHASAGSRGWQRLTGLLALAFVVFHVATVPTAPADIYATFDATLGQPRYLLVWVLGLTALFAHLAEGLPASLRTLHLIGGDTQVGQVRAFAHLVAAAGWVWSMNSLAHFATGAAYMGAR